MKLKVKLESFFLRILHNACSGIQPGCTAGGQHEL